MTTYLGKKKTVSFEGEHVRSDPASAVDTQPYDVAAAVHEALTGTTVDDTKVLQDSC